MKFFIHICGDICETAVYDRSNKQCKFRALFYRVVVVHSKVSWGNGVSNDSRDIGRYDGTVTRYRSLLCHLEIPNKLS